MSYLGNSFPLLKGGVNVNTAGDNVLGVVLCITDGSIDVVWKDNTTDSVPLLAGMMFNLHSAKSAVVATGSYHIA